MGKILSISSMILGVKLKSIADASSFKWEGDRVPGIGIICSPLDKIHEIANVEEATLWSLA